MPELPEVETVRSQLAKSITGKTFASVDRVEPAMLRDCTEAFLRSQLPGRRIDSVERLGKFLIVPLDGGLCLTLHLGMTGQLLVDPGEGGCGAEEHTGAGRGDGDRVSGDRDGTGKSEGGKPAGGRGDGDRISGDRDGTGESEGGKPAGGSESPHTRFVFRLETSGSAPTVLEFRDMRKFGRLHLIEGGAAPRLRDLGPDAWLGEWDGAYLGARMKNRRAPLKAFLLDQRHLAGIGNIYADEVLWWAGLSPLRPCGSLTAGEVDRLAEEIPHRLGEGVRLLGCSLSDFVDTYGEPGTFQQWLRAYGRHGRECLRCGGKLVRVVVAGRGTAYCPDCQR